MILWPPADNQVIVFLRISSQGVFLDDASAGIIMMNAAFHYVFWVRSLLLFSFYLSGVNQSVQ